MIDQALQVPEDIRFVPARDLTPALRTRLDAAPDDVAVSRPASRTAGVLLDGEAAGFLDEFRQPTSIVDAVLRRSLETGRDAQSFLDEALPFVLRLLDSGLLVPEGSDLAAPILPTLESGGRLDGFEIVRPVQVLADTEVYEAVVVDASGSVTNDGTPRRAAVKIARPGAAGWVRDSLIREAALLDELDGRVAPKLLAVSALDERPYVSMEWVHGTPATAVAKRLRTLPLAEARLRLLRLAGAVVDAYRHLHRVGVLHGDVHPGNLMLEEEGTVRLLDFGLGRRCASEPDDAVARGAVPVFAEPEYARALLDDLPPPTSSALGEQYSVAAVLYLLLSGATYLSFSPSKRDVWRQIVGEEPADFAAHGVRAWPEVEAVLRRGLAKDPERRYPDVATLANALSDVERRLAAGVRPSGSASRALARTTESVRGKLVAAAGGGMPVAPTASLNCGAAGVAYGLLRMSAVREDADLLAAADLWITRARRDADGDDGFCRASLGMAPEPESVWNGRAGVEAVEALVARAFDDAPRQRRALRRFVRTVAPSAGSCLDVTDGTAGNLLATSLLLAADLDGAVPVLPALGERLRGVLWDRLVALEPIGRAAMLPGLGIAHGWAGFLYATLLWCRVCGSEPEEPVLERLEQLAQYAEPWRRGLRFPASLAAQDEAGPRRYWSGWCNGSAGFVLLWALAHDLLQDDRWWRLAEGSAAYVWEGEERTASLCCGDAGRAYALASLHRRGADSVWLDRSRRLAERAVHGYRPTPEYEHSLYQGDLGLAVLATDLEDPSAAAFPFFEPPL